MFTRVGTISFLIGFRNLTVLRAEPRSRELRAASSIDRLRSREAIYNQSRQRFGRRRVSGSNTLQAAIGGTPLRRIIGYPAPLNNPAHRLARRRGRRRCSEGREIVARSVDPALDAG